MVKQVNFMDPLYGLLTPLYGFENEVREVKWLLKSPGQLLVGS